MSYQVASGTYVSPDGGKSYIPAGGIAEQIAENLLADRATVNVFPPRNLHNLGDLRVPFSAQLLTYDALLRYGK